jgi:hypothetical protein
VSVSNHRPSSANSTWRSLRFGSDTLTLSPSRDSRACNRCTYYVAVYGSTESAYTLTITESDTVTVLTAGVPVSSRVGFLQWDWFSYTYHTAPPHSLSLLLSPSTGNPDLYVSLGTLLFLSPSLSLSLCVFVYWLVFLSFACLHSF